MNRKIAIIATYSGNSGASHSLVKLAEELRNNFNYDVIVICPKEGFLTEELNKKKINYKIFKYYPWVISKEKMEITTEKYKWFIKRMINYYSEKRFQFFVKKNNFDLIHINASTASFGAQTALKKDIPLIWHLREFIDQDLQKEFWNKKSSLDLISKASAQIAISNSVKNRFSEELLSNNIYVIYNGVDDLMFDPRDKQVKEKKVITVLGRIVPKKGQIDAIRAMGILVNDLHITDFKLEIVGSVGDQDYYSLLLNEISRLNLEEYCALLGAVKNPFEYLDKVYMSLVCSESEAFGRVTVESIFRNAFVIGKNTAGTSEILEDERILYKEISDLANKIFYYLNHEKEMNKLLNEKKEILFKKFKSSNNTNQINKLYLEKIEENNNAD